MKKSPCILLLAISGGLWVGSLFAGTPNYVRANLQISSVTRYPVLAGVPQLTTPESGHAPKFYKKLAFSGGRDLAVGPLVANNAGGRSAQYHTALSGDITFTYVSATDSVSWTNQTLMQDGVVYDVPPWDPNTTDWPQPPVLTTQVPVSGGGPIPYGSYYISASNPLGLPVVNATQAAEANVFYPPAGSGTNGNAFSAAEHQDYLAMELSDEDTRQLAEERAKRYLNANVTSPADISTIGGAPTPATSTWTIREIHVKYRFSGSEVCNGGNLYERRIVYQRRALGAAEWVDYRTDNATIPIKDNVGEGEFDMPLEEGYEIRLADLTFEGVGSGCASCLGGSGLPGGNQGAKTGSISWQIPLGLTATGDSAGYLTLYSPNITPVLYTPAALRASVLGETAAVALDAQKAVRQVLAPQALADIVTTGVSSYEIRFYDRTAVGAPGGDGLYAASGSPYLTWRVDGSPGVWRTTRIIGAQSVVMAEVDETVAGRRLFTEAGGLRVTETTETTEGSDRVEDVVVKNAAGEISSRKKSYYHPFAWGEERVKEILDPAGVAMATQWSYVTNPGSGAYRKVASITRPDGSVESTVYQDDASGQISSRSVPLWKQSIKDTGYLTSLTDLDGDGTADFLTTVFENMFLSNLSLNHTIQWGAPVTVGGIKYKLRDQRRAPVPGAVWNHPSNIITRERYYAEGVHAGELAYRLNPDGTLLLHRYTANPDGGTSTIEEEGTADAALEAVTDGTRTVRVLSPRGWEASTLVTDIASNRTLRSETVGQTDSYGRPTRLLHLDGAEEVRSYCNSCGAVEQISLRGATVAYEFDELGRKLWETRSAGVTVLSRQRFVYDADGRLTKTFRVNPVENTETLLAATNYDLAGRMTSTTSLSSGTTTYGYVFGVNNSTVTTTTYADSGTRIETRGASGTVFKLQGTAVAPIEYDWGARSWDGRGTGYLAYTRRYYSSTDYGTEVSGMNFLGEVADTTLPDGAVSSRYFDAIGRLVREVDPDGVTTLYGYDARGRSAITAVDLNGNNVIDYNGSDRITRTLFEVAVRDGRTVQRSTTQAWETDGQDTPTTVSVNEQSADGLASWQTRRGLTSATVTAYDGAGGRTVTTTAPDGTVTAQTFSGDRLLSLVTSHATLGSLGSVAYAYNALGQLTSNTDVRNGTTTYTYDAQDRLHIVTTHDPDPARSGPGYDPQTTTLGYDVMGRQTTVTQPDGGVVNTTYWPTGAVRRTWGSRTYPTEYTYDIQLRVTTLTTWQDFATATGAAVTTWNYNPARGWLDNKRYADNTGPNYTYKSSGRLLRRTWARGVQTNYVYDVAGDLTSITYSDGTPAVTLTYDRAGRQQSRTDAAGVCTWTYDASGQLKDEDYTAGLLNGLGVHRTFDSLARLGSIYVPSVYSAGYTYDAASRLNTVTQGTNTATYSYVPNSPLVGTVTFKQSDASRLTTTKSYDKLNRLSSISSAPSAPSASSAVSSAYAYNSANQRTKLTREDNAYWQYEYDALGQVTAGRKHLPTDAIVSGLDFGWTFDDIGNRKTSTVNAQISNYPANSLNQYAQRSVPGVLDVMGEAQADSTISTTYPATGGAISRPSRQGTLFYQQLNVNNAAVGQYASVKITGVKNQVGPAGEDAVTEVTRNTLVPVTPEVFSHDADGNLTDDARWHYSWDGENRLVGIVTSSAAATVGVPRQKLEFAYDGQGRRTSKKMYSWSSGSWILDSSLLFLYDGWNLLADLDSVNSNAVVHTYTWGLDLSGSYQGAGGVGGLLFASNPTSTHFAAYDGNGNVTAYVDASTGSKSASYDYNAFGETVTVDGPAQNFFPFRFSTKYVDSETGLIYYGHRFYSPNSGRWLSRDPIQERGGYNLYGFCDNNSVNRFDSLGMVVKYLDPSGIVPSHVGESPRSETMPNGKVMVELGRATPSPFRARYTTKIDDCCTELHITGSLSVSIKIVDGTDDLLSVNGISVRDHEFIHAGDFATGWNAYAKIANAVEGKWCGKGCVKKAAEVDDAAYNVYLAYSDLMGKNLDHREYGRPFASEQQNYNSAVEKLVMKTAELTSTCPR
jgi:RHS repeat-associated protein